MAAKIIAPTLHRNIYTIEDLPIGRLISFTYGEKLHIALSTYLGLISLTDPHKTWGKTLKIRDIPNFTLLPENTIIEYSYDKQ